MWGEEREKTKMLLPGEYVYTAQLISNETGALSKEHKYLTKK